mmetsp:Transcript_37130/g.104811  ORF Transcript_37130/g.104811 Transcript_37130/m.104811 type:complete len:96 (+) Transcript_37130:825-1112(+)
MRVAHLPVGLLLMESMPGPPTIRHGFRGSTDSGRQLQRSTVHNNGGSFATLQALLAEQSTGWAEAGLFRAGPEQRALDSSLVMDKLPDPIMATKK